MWAGLYAPHFDRLSVTHSGWEKRIGVIPQNKKCADDFSPAHPNIIDNLIFHYLEPPPGPPAGEPESPCFKSSLLTPFFCCCGLLKVVLPKL